MSKPTLTPRVIQWLRGTWSMDILLTLVDSGLTPREIRDLLRLVSDHRETLAAANMVRRHGQEYAGEHRVRLALECPFITEGEALGWSIPVEPTKKPNLRWHNRKGFVYLMRNSRNGLIKIGFSKNPKFREQTLQSEEPEIELIYSKKGTAKDELQLHARYAAKRMRGEWFALNENEVEAIKRK